MLFRRSARRGFTLLELIVVLVVLGILAALAIVTFSSTVGRSKTATATASAQSFDRELRAVAALNQSSPLSASVLTAAQSDAPAGAVVTPSPSYTTDGLVTVAASGISVCLTVSPNGAPGTVAAGACVTGNPDALAVGPVIASWIASNGWSGPFYTPPTFNNAGRWSVSGTDAGPVSANVTGSSTFHTAGADSTLWCFEVQTSGGSYRYSGKAGGAHGAAGSCTAGTDY